MTKSTTTKSTTHKPTIPSVTVGTRDLRTCAAFFITNLTFRSNTIVTNIYRPNRDYKN